MCRHLAITAQSIIAVEVHCRRPPLRGIVDLEEWAPPKGEEARHEHVGELGQYGVQITDYSVVVAPRVLDAVFDLGKVLLQHGNLSLALRSG